VKTAAASVAANANLSYDGSAVDPREGTLSAWIRLDWDGVADPTLDQTERAVFAFQPDAWHEELRVYFWHRYVLAARAYGSGTASLAQTEVTKWRAGEWHHVAASWSASAGTITLYVDGVKVNAGSFTAPTGSAPLQVGCLRYQGAGLQGSVDRFQVFKWALSDAEIAALAK
jgi:hypothetical protein